MRKIYLVKKNPEQPADGNNWIVMNSFEFMNFVKTPDGQKRKACFGQLDACSVDDVIIIAECGAETAKQWRSEKDRHDYLVSIENQSGMTVFSYNTQTTTEDDMSGEELLVDQDCSVIDAILKKEEKSTLYAAVAKLSPAEINLMTSLYLCDDPICESGANLKFIQSILGHADVSTTMNIYVDVTDALKKKEITAFDDYMTTKLET